jgi:hypothetical protein
MACESDSQLIAKGGEMSNKSFYLGATLVLMAAALNAQTPAPNVWSNWLSTTTSSGATVPSIEYRWRSTPPCTPGGCSLGVEIRNTSSSPVQFHYSIYTDNPGPQYAGGSYGTTNPVVGDVSLKAFGGAMSGTGSAGDTTNSIAATGFKIVRVVVGNAASSNAFVGQWQGDSFSLVVTQTGSALTMSDSNNLTYRNVRISGTTLQAEWYGNLNGCGLWIPFTATLSQDQGTMSATTLTNVSVDGNCNITSSSPYTMTLNRASQ